MTDGRRILDGEDDDDEALEEARQALLDRAASTSSTRAAWAQITREQRLAAHPEED